ncbi:MAG: glycosyltransferase [Pedobacter sp.]
MMFFEGVTLLITHFNRSESLERLLLSFKSLDCSFEHIIVSDDKSSDETISKLKALAEKYNFSLLTTPVNRGLANNINKGQYAVKTPYVLYVQEDFVPQELFPSKFKIALEIMKSSKEYDIIRFYAYFKYPFLKSYNSDFSEMQFSILPWYPGYQKFYMYSDHPHLRRNDFCDKFGHYIEGIPSDAAEYKMMMTFLKRKGKALFYNNYQELFTQENTEDEPSTINRHKLRQSNNIVISFVRDIYRHVKFNVDYLR